jgi:hypothetical protein
MKAGTVRLIALFSLTWLLLGCPSASPSPPTGPSPIPSPTDSVSTASPTGPTTTPSPVGASTCIDFEAPLAVGTEYGAPAGHASGDVVFTEAGIPVAVFDFSWTATTGTFNVAHVEAAPAGFGSGQVMRINNINLEFDFTTLGFTPSRVDLQFQDLGGNENLSVNGDPIPPFPGELTAAPSSLGGVGVASSVSGTGVGTATFTGPVERLLIGGQEFWLDHVCAYE